MEESKRSSCMKRPRVASEKRRECLDLFEKGYGYKKTAKLSGLNTYTVRDYSRRYNSGDVTGAERGRRTEV